MGKDRVRDRGRDKDRDRERDRDSDRQTDRQTKLSNLPMKQTMHSTLDQKYRQTRDKARRIDKKNVQQKDI